jgi:hypothetical protein
MGSFPGPKRRVRRERARDFSTAVSLTWLSLGVLVPACDAPSPTGVPLVPAGRTQCPSLVLSISAGEDEVRDDATVSAGAPAADPSGPVSFLWSATAGSFADPGAASTRYRCPRSSSTSLQTITVSASRGPCTVTQQIVVICAGFTAGGAGSGGTLGGGAGGAAGTDGPDAGADPDVGAQAGDGGGDAADAGREGGDASGGFLTCGLADSTIDEGEACNRCTLDNCTTLESARRDVPVTDGCHHLKSDADRVRCQALYCCIRAQHCVVQGDATPCWCGTTDAVACMQGTEPPNGPCRSEFQAAAGTAEVAQIALEMIDPTLPIGGAVNLATCRASFCAEPPAPACAGFSQ